MKKYEQIFEAYKLGDKYSRDFDYEGMLNTCLNVKITDSISKLEKLFNSLEDVNYHTEAKELDLLIKELKDGNKKGAKYYLETFKKVCKDELESW